MGEMDEEEIDRLLSLAVTNANYGEAGFGFGKTEGIMGEEEGTTGFLGFFDMDKLPEHLKGEEGRVGAKK